MLLLLLFLLLQLLILPLLLISLLAIAFALVASASYANDIAFDPIGNDIITTRGYCFSSTHKTYIELQGDVRNQKIDSQRSLVAQYH
jgi:hypothetical protein